MKQRTLTRGLLAGLALAAGAMLAGPAGAGARAAAPANVTTAGAFDVELPTLLSAGFDWWITGDANRNAKVELSYRKKGETAWKPAQPLLRLQNEDVNAMGGNTNKPYANGMLLARPLLLYKVPNMFSGSLFNLTPDTAYEARLTLSDPDGVRGTAVRVASFRTRKEPQVPTGGRTYHVYPWNYQGPKQQPAFTGLLAAYYMESRHADWAYATPFRVQPGDVILVHAGTYIDTPSGYGEGVEGQTEPRLGTEFDGTYYLTQKGTADRPIVIKAAGDGEVIFDGGGNQTLFNMMAADHHYIEGITFRNTEIALLLGIQRIAGATGFTLKRSKFENIARGVQGDWSGAKNFYIADNVFIGRHPADKLMGWTAAWRNFPGFPERISGPGGSEYAVKVYGEGHVVAHNYLANWHDGVDVATYGDPDGVPNGIESRFPKSIDFYGNDFTNMADNCIEADGGGRNIRVFANRCLNAVGGAFSAQTIFGGPAYFFRNVEYTGMGGSLKYSITPTGIINWNNTYIADNNNTGMASNVHFRNNLFIAHAAQGQAFGASTYTNYSSSDYNGFMAAPSAKEPFVWSSPPFNVRRDFNSAVVQRRYANLGDYSRETGQDRNSIMVDYGIFQKMSPPDLNDPQRVYKLEEMDFRLKPGSAPIDKGVALANVTDGYAGAAPDLGAYELGQPIPHYGPRPAQ